MLSDYYHCHCFNDKVYLFVFSHNIIEGSKKFTVIFLFGMYWI